MVWCHVTKYFFYPVVKSKGICDYDNRTREHTAMYLSCCSHLHKVCQLWCGFPGRQQLNTYWPTLCSTQNPSKSRYSNPQPSHHMTTNYSWPSIWILLILHVKLNIVAPKKSEYCICIASSTLVQSICHMRVKSWARWWQRQVQHLPVLHTGHDVITLVFIITYSMVLLAHGPIRYNVSHTDASSCLEQ